MLVVAKTRGRGRGVFYFPNFFSSIFVVQFSCTVIFEWPASVLHLWWKLVKKLRNPRQLWKFLRDILFFFFLNRTLFFCVSKSKLVFASIWLCLSENRSLLFEIKRISKIAEIGVYEIYANCQRHWRLAELHTLKSHCNVYFVKNRITLPMWPSGNVGFSFACLFVLLSMLLSDFTTNGL